MKRAASVAAVAAAAVAACAWEEGNAPPFAPLDSDGTHFRDELGRAVILRGVNARVEGVFDVTFDDGRTPLEPIPPLEPSDCALMRQWGFNLLRLPINWSGIEPERDRFSEEYLVAVDAAIECAAGAGVWVLVDLHQDAYSKEIGEDGAPLWAISPPPEMLLEGPLEDLEARRTSPQVMAAFDTFFDPADPAGLQAEYLDMLEHVALRWRADDAVIGFEIFNEPVASAERLHPFQIRAAERLRRAAPAKLIFFEPPAVRNLLDFQPLSSEPFPVSGAVYAPHVYTLAFGDPMMQLETLTIEDLRPSVDNARAEAIAWGTPLFIGEYGIGPDAVNFDRYIRYQLDLQDQYVASSAFWLWKEESQGHWGLFTRTPTGWIEREEMIAELSRPYLQRIAGTPESLAWSPDALTFTASFSSPVDAPHVLHVPPTMTLVSATCAGASLPPATELTCATPPLVVSFARP